MKFSSSLLPALIGGVFVALAPPPPLVMANGMPNAAPKVAIASCGIGQLICSEPKPSKWLRKGSRTQWHPTARPAMLYVATPVMMEDREEIAIKVERSSIGSGAVYLKCRQAQTAARVRELFSPSMRHDHVAPAVARLQRRNSSPTSSDRQRILTAEATSLTCHWYISRGSLSVCEVLRSL